MNPNNLFKPVFGLIGLLSTGHLSAQFNADLTGYWPLDTNLTDASSNGGDGTFASNGVSTSPSFTSGGVGAGSARFGEAILLTAANEERVSIDGAGNPGFLGEDTYDFTGGSTTISFWCSTTAGFTSSWQALVAKGENSGWRVSRRGDDNVLAYAGGFGNDSAEGTSDASVGLHHVVAVTDAARGIYLYVDGQLESFVPGNPALTDSASFMEIGGNPINGGRTLNGTIDDVLLFARPLTGPEVATIYNNGNGTVGSDIVTSADGDSDGIPDFYEIANGLNPAVDDAAGDLDSDNLSNLDEYNAGLGANNNDADGDGLFDGDEIANNADPLNPDSDGDGLSDGDEVNIHSTLPDNPDSDNDQATDFDEVKANTDPNDDTDFPSSWSLGLVGYWNFDNSLADTSGTGADGTFINDTAGSPVYALGKFGDGISLDSLTNDRVEIQSVPESTYDFTGADMTVSLWCSTTGFTENWQGIIAKGEGTSWRIARAAGTNQASFNPGEWKPDGDDIQGGDISDGSLHHIVAVTNTAGTGQLWVDGVKVAETTAPPIIGNTSLNMLIGGNPGADGFRTWPGIIDDVAIWGRPLSASEIGRIYAGGGGTSINGLINDPDTDGDGLPDSWEIANMTDRLVADADADPDLDQRTNIQEFQDGTNPQDDDSDDDLLKDGEEATAGSNPLVPDTDRDNLSDGDEVITHMTDPTLHDTDMDGFSDSVELEYSTDPNLDTSFPSLDQGLLGYWPLDEDFIDDTNSGGDGTYFDNAAGSPVFQTGKYGNAILFDWNNNQYVTIDGAGVSTPPDYTQAGESVSISVWSSVTTFSENWQGLVARGEGSAWRVAGRGTNGNNTGQYAYAGGTGDIVSPLSYDDGQFHHIVAVTEKGFNVRLYIDGVKVSDSGTNAPLLSDNNNANNILIGGNPDAITRSWNGLVDDVAIWARPLSDTEISDLFMATQSLGQQLGLGLNPELRITNVTKNSNGTVTLTWNSKDSATANYGVFASNDLSLPLESWLEVIDEVPSAGVTTSFTVPSDTIGGADKLFFYVREN
ncbi:MAG: LamG-like jellyroll fold domain-containing protein [Verrucomicrobiaceae bacterium]